MKGIVVIVVLIFMCSGVFAASGVSPANYEVDFVPGYTGEFVFNFLMDSDNADLYVNGKLAKYVSLDKHDVSGREEVIATLTLPENIDVQGVSSIKIGAGDVWSFIRVNVPFSEKYVNIELNAPNVNVGKDVFLEIELSGKGSEAVVVSPRVEILKEVVVVEIIELDPIEVLPGDEIDVNISLDTGDYVAGDYVAVVFIDYDNKSVSAENSFRLGEFSVRLVNYTRALREHRVGEFEIIVENLWDNDIEEVYAKISVLNFDSPGSSTSPKHLSAWEEVTLSGFLDTTDIKGDSFEVEIILYYGNKITSETVTLVLIDGIDYVFWIVVVIIFIGLVFLLRRSIGFFKKFEKHLKKKK